MVIFLTLRAYAGDFRRLLPSDVRHHSPEGTYHHGWNLVRHPHVMVIDISLPTFIASSGHTSLVDLSRAFAGAGLLSSVILT